MVPWHVYLAIFKGYFRLGLVEKHKWKQKLDSNLCDDIDEVKNFAEEKLCSPNLMFSCIFAANFHVVGQWFNFCLKRRNMMSTILLYKYCHQILISRCNFDKLCLMREYKQTSWAFSKSTILHKNLKVPILVLHRLASFYIVLLTLAITKKWAHSRVFIAPRLRTTVG